MAERYRTLADGTAQRHGDVVGADASVLAGRSRKRMLARSERFSVGARRASFAVTRRKRCAVTRRKRLEQQRDRSIGLSRDEEIDRRESLVIHAPPTM